MKLHNDFIGTQSP